MAGPWEAYQQPQPQTAPQPQAMPPAGGPMPQVTPQPFPGGVVPNPLRQADALRADARLGLDYRQNARSEEQLRMEAERLRISQQTAAAEEAKRKASGGFELGAEENKAAGLLFDMRRSAALIKQIETEFPQAIRPSIQEITAATSGSDFLTNAAIPKEVRSARIALNGAYRDFIQSAIYQASGAAFQKDELESLTKTLQPSYWDDEFTLRMKKYQLESKIGAAMLKAGAGQAKVEEALRTFSDSTADIWKPKINYGAKEKPAYQLSDDNKTTVPIPPEMQKEYEGFLNAHPPGTLTTEGLINFRRELDKKYGFSDQPITGVEDYVKAYNAGHAGTTIPAAERQLNETGQLMNDVAQSPGGVFVKNFANAMTAGAPEFLAGREGRYASELADQKHPWSALAGDVLGSIAPSVGATAVAGAAGLGSVTSEMAANALYGGVRGAAEAEPENRTTAALVGAGVGGLAPVAARAAVKGARGFLEDGAIAAIDDVAKPKTFTMPSDRQPLPADDITPARFQGFSDDQLRAEIENARRGLEGRKVVEGKIKANQLAREKADAPVWTDIANLAKYNTRRQKEWLSQNVGRRMQMLNPDQVAAMTAKAEELFPTKPETLAKSPAFSKRFYNKPDPTFEGLEDSELLNQRIARLEDHLQTDGTPKSGTIPGVDLTTLSRVGMAKTEQAVQGLPGVAGAREKAMEGFNRQNSARVLANIGEELPSDIRAGQDANAFVNQRLNRFYNDRVRPLIQGKVDQNFASAIAAIRSKVTQGDTARLQLWNEIQAKLARFGAVGETFDGTKYQQLSEDLRNLAKDWLTKDGPTPMERELGRAAEQVRRQVQALVTRANPAAGQRLKMVEKAWAHQMRIDVASRGAATANRGVYDPQRYLSSIERLDTSANKAAVSRGQAFDQPYAQNAREVLGGPVANIPNVGQSATVAAALHFAGIPAGAVVSGLGLGYVPGVKRLVQAIIDGKVGTTADAIGSAIRGSGDSKLRTWAAKPANADAVQNLINQLVQAEARNAQKSQEK